MSQDNAYNGSLLTLYAGRFISTAGDKLYIVALTFILARHQAYDLTWLWMIGLIAPLIMQWFTGSLADRLGAKRTAVIGELLCAVATGMMPLVLHSNWLFVLVFVNAAAGTFFMSASQPMVSSLTTDTNRHQVNSIMSTVNASATFIGPLLGGWLTLQSVSLPFVAQGASFLFSALTIALLPLPLPKQEDVTAKGKGMRVFWADVRMGLGYLRKNAVMRNLIWMTSLLNFGTGAISAYEALFLTRAVHLGASGYGIVVAVNGLGMVVAGMINARYARRWKPIVLVPIGALVLLVGFIPYAFSTSLIMVGVSVLIVSMGLISLITAVRTVRQNTVPLEIQGRVISLQMILPTLTAGLSVLVGGALLPILPIRTIIIGAVAILFLCIPVALNIFRLASLPSDPQTKTVAEVS